MSTIQIIDNEHIEIIMRQTNYDKDLATKKLIEWEHNYINVIREYMNPSFQEKKTVKKKSIQQNVISEIRNFMDTVSMGYEERKSKQKKIDDEKKKEGRRTEKENVKKNKYEEKGY